MSKSTHSCIAPKLVASDSEFQRVLRNEKRRAERSGRPIVVVTLRTTKPSSAPEGSGLGALVASILVAAMRGTDLVAWCDGAVGILCTETGASPGEDAGTAIVQRLKELLSTALPAEEFNSVEFSFETVGAVPLPASDITEREKVLAQ